MASPHENTTPRGTFSSLRNRDFRLLWLGMLLSHTGDWVDQVALNWLVLQMTGSPTYLGILHLLRGVALFSLSLVGGVVADRSDRRLMLVMTQLGFMCIALAFVAMSYLDFLWISLIFTLSFIRGGVMAFNLPARHTLVSDLVPQELLPNAVALMSVTLNLTKIIGPAIGGLIVAAYGVQVCFVVNAASFVFVFCALSFIRKPDVMVRDAREQPNPLGSLFEGFGYVKQQKNVLWLLVIAYVTMFLGHPYIQLLAVFADRVYDIGPRGFGLLVSTSGFGAVVGGLCVATFPALAKQARLMLICVAIYGLFLLLFSINSITMLAFPLLFGAGMMQIAYGTSNNAILQLSTERHMRGRVLSMLFLARGMVSLGTAFLAAMADIIGVQAALGFAAILILATTVSANIFLPNLRKLSV